MKTLTVDDQKRVRIPDAVPRQVFSYENCGGIRTLTPIEPIRPPSARIVKVAGRKYLTSSRPVSNADTEAVMSRFP